MDPAEIQSEDRGVFERVERDGVAIHTAPSVFESCGVGLAFSERAGGVSLAPYGSMNLAGHVGDDPSSVDRNREILLESIGIAAIRERLTTAVQVHGASITRVSAAIAGSGAFVGRGPAPVADCDALWTTERGVPLMLLYADCVPVVLVRPSAPAVAVVHAGWRGLASGVLTQAAAVMAALDGADDLTAFVGPHIGACCYEVGDDVKSRFLDHGGEAGPETPTLDLGAIVARELAKSGVPEQRQFRLALCTAHNTDRFFSHRAEGLTGRHGALAVIL